RSGESSMVEPAAAALVTRDAHASGYPWINSGRWKMDLQLEVTTTATRSTRTITLEDYYLCGRRPGNKALALYEAKESLEVEFVILKSTQITAKVIRVGSYGDVVIDGVPLAPHQCMPLLLGQTLSAEGITILLKIEWPSTATANFLLRCDE